jgi:hypothetical protein
MFKTFLASRRLAFACLILFSALALNNTSAQQGPTPTVQPSPNADPLKALQYRLVGPFRGGRVTAVAGVASQPMVYYFGATGGGVWKTTDGGINWEAGLRTSYYLSKNLRAAVSANYERLHHSVALSPIVERPYVFGYFAGLAWQF